MRALEASAKTEEQQSCSHKQQHCVSISSVQYCPIAAVRRSSSNNNNSSQLYTVAVAAAVGTVVAFAALVRQL